jgi:hypothetical protein
LQTQKEDGPVLRLISNDHAIPAGPALAPTSDSLLDEAAAEIGVDEAALGSGDRLKQTAVRDAFLPRVAREPLRLEDVHCAN